MWVRSKEMNRTLDKKCPNTGKYALENSVFGHYLRSGKLIKMPVKNKI